MNDTMGNDSATMREDKSIPGQMVTNATLAYAQEDEIQEKLEHLSIKEKKTMTEIVVLALKDYLKQRNRTDIKLSS
jgi:hypothetical protein